MATKVSLQTLLAEVRVGNAAATVNAKGATLFNAERRVIQGPNYADTDGFHIYTHLRLRLRLTNAEEDEHAARLLEIIQLFAKLAEDCGRVAGVEHLEVQGKRNHFLLLCKMNDEANLRRLLAFSIALARVVESEVRPLAGDDWVGFAMTADHGRAVLVSSRPFDPSDSLISLGPAAGAPAKKLNRPVSDGGVPDGRLAVNMACFGRPSDPEARASWQEFNLTGPTAFLREDIDRLTEEMLAAVRSDVLLFNRGPGAPGGRTVHFSANSAEFVDVSSTTFKEPRKVQGFAMRVDLDGFTAQVRLAFRAGDDRAIEALVNRFNEILTYPRQFRDRMNRPMIMLPWAGDQANLILLLRPGGNLRRGPRPPRRGGRPGLARAKRVR